jgi:hypothetical protein
LVLNITSHKRLHGPTFNIKVLWTNHHQKLQHELRVQNTLVFKCPDIVIFYGSSFLVLLYLLLHQVLIDDILNLHEALFHTFFFRSLDFVLNYLFIPCDEAVLGPKEKELLLVDAE